MALGHTRVDRDRDIERCLHDRIHAIAEIGVHEGQTRLEHLPARDARRLVLRLVLLERLIVAGANDHRCRVQGVVGAANIEVARFFVRCASPAFREHDVRERFVKTRCGQRALGALARFRFTAQEPGNNLVRGNAEKRDDRNDRERDKGNDDRVAPCARGGSGSHTYLSPSPSYCAPPGARWVAHRRTSYSRDMPKRSRPGKTPTNFDPRYAAKAKKGRKRAAGASGGAKPVGDRAEWVTRADRVQAKRQLGNFVHERDDTSDARRKPPAGGRGGPKPPSGRNGSKPLVDRGKRVEAQSGRAHRNNGSADASDPRDLDKVHARLKGQQVAADAGNNITFADLGFGDNIVRALAALGAAQPFPVQAASIPAVLEGRDVLARGRTGSGKTIAFGAPLVERVLLSYKGDKREFGRSPRALILAPTRELALQIDRTVQPIARSVGLFTTQVYGGVPQARQVGALRKGVDIVIGTPGRVEDLAAQGKLDLDDIRVAVLDEADHMAELGFVESIERILRLVPRKSQKLLFSATLDREVESLVREFLADPAVFEVAGETQKTGTIEHRVLVIDHRDKPAVLESLLERPGRTLVFTRTRAFAEMLAEQFFDAGIGAVALHGDLNQTRRTRNLGRFTNGDVNVLVATDVAARGIHVDDIDLVIQADPPDEYKTYLHRSGRTGRAGNTGRVVTLITKSRQQRMRELLERADISAPFDMAQPGDQVLDELAGREPTLDELDGRRPRKRSRG